MRQAYQWRRQLPSDERIVRMKRSHKSAIRKKRKEIPFLWASGGNCCWSACENQWSRCYKATPPSNKHQWRISSNDALGSLCQSWCTCWNTRTNRWTLSLEYHWIFCNTILPQCLYCIILYCIYIHQKYINKKCINKKVTKAIKN